MYDFLQIYSQMRHSNRYSISSFVRLYRIVNDLRMEQQIINVLNLAKYNQLEHLQWKVEYLASTYCKRTFPARSICSHISDTSYRRYDMKEESDMPYNSLIVARASFLKNSC